MIRRVEAGRTQLWGKDCALSVRGGTANVHLRAHDDVVAEGVGSVQARRIGMRNVGNVRAASADPRDPFRRSQTPPSVHAAI